MSKWLLWIVRWPRSAAVWTANLLLFPDSWKKYIANGLTVAIWLDIILLTGIFLTRSVYGP